MVCIHTGTAAALGKRQSRQHITFPGEGSIKVLLPAEMANALDLSVWGSSLGFLGNCGYWLVLFWFFHNCNHSCRVGPVALEGLPSWHQGWGSWQPGFLCPAGQVRRCAAWSACCQLCCVEQVASRCFKYLCCSWCPGRAALLHLCALIAAKADLSLCKCKTKEFYCLRDLSAHEKPG